MGFELTLFSAGFQHALLQKQAVSEIMKCNDLAAQYGLSLSESQAIALVETRSVALKKTGRIEFGGGAIDKIIAAFCDSPYLSTDNYEKTLHELISIFYYYKNETLDLIGDDELLIAMEKAFNGICQGSLDLLFGRELEQLSRTVRYGFKPEAPCKGLDTDEDDDAIH